LGLATGGAWHTKYVLIITRQIGESAAQLARAREEMVERALARARDMEQLSATLSHELKNPLAAIKTLVELAARDPADASSREGLHVARTEIDRMRGILQEYLSFSRPFERVSSEPVELAALSDEVLQLLGPSADRIGVNLRRRGVALARAAFVQHGGALEFRSAEGRGTTATGTLPISRRSDGASALRG